MDWKEKIIALMKQRHWSQKDLALRSGITEASVSRYLNGERKPRMDVLVNFSKALNISLDSLLGEEKNTSSAYENIASVIARNGGDLTDSEKNKLISLLVSFTGEKNV